jgi:hypothetical protein
LAQTRQSIKPESGCSNLPQVSGLATANRDARNAASEFYIAAAFALLRVIDDSRSIDVQTHVDLGDVI